MAIRLMAMVMGLAITAVTDTPITPLSAATGATNNQSIVFVVTTFAPAMTPSGATVSFHHNS
jgi:hypothetical protein